MKIKVEVYNDGDVWCARGVKHDIFTCAKSLDKLIKGIQEATCCHFQKKIKNKTIEVVIKIKPNATRISKTSPGKR